MKARNGSPSPSDANARRRALIRSLIERVRHSDSLPADEAPAPLPDNVEPLVVAPAERLLRVISADTPLAEIIRFPRQRVNDARA